MQLPETMTTARLRLRRPAGRDLARVFEYGSDLLVTRFMDWPRHERIETAAEFLAGCEPRWKSGEEYAWVITQPPDDAALGMIGCRVRSGTAMFGFVLHRDAWGHGIATEASAALIESLEGLATIARVEATCDAENVASAHVLEKLGLALESRRMERRPNLGEELRVTTVYARALKFPKGERR